MPITTPVPLQWVINTLHVDMVNVQATVTFTGTVGTQVVGTTSFDIPQADFIPLITANPTAGMTRQNDLTTAIYAYAVAKGYVTGTVS